MGHVLDVAVGKGETPIAGGSLCVYNLPKGRTTPPSCLLEHSTRRQGGWTPLSLWTSVDAAQLVVDRPLVMDPCFKLWGLSFGPQ